MADSHDEVERTEAPSPRRLVQARQQGHLPRSRELVAACVVLVAVAALRLSGGRLGRSLLDFTRDRLAAAESSATSPGMGLDLSSKLSCMLPGLLPILLFPATVAVIATLAQTGLRLHPIADPARFNIANGLRMFFSWQSIGGALIASLKWTAALAISLWWTWSDMRSLLVPSDQQPEPFVGQAAETILKFGTNLALWLVAFGLMDYARAWWSWRREMQMSRPELRAEAREAEGDPLLKRWRRQRQMAQSRSRSTPVLQSSDVVFVGKGRLAVATRGAADASAFVVAKAIGPAADRLVQTARRCGARIVRDDTTARTLYRTDQPRPADAGASRSASLLR